MKTKAMIVALILGLFPQAKANHIYMCGQFEIYPDSGWGLEEVDYMISTYMYMAEAEGDSHHVWVTFRQGTLSWINHTLGMQAFWYLTELGDQFTSEYTANNPDKSLRGVDQPYNRNDLYIGFDDQNDGDFFLGVEYEINPRENPGDYLQGYGWMHLRSEGGLLHKLGDSGGGQLSGIEIGVHAVPEPGTIALLGLAGLVMLIRRRFVK